MRELLARIDARELTEWLAYYRLEPWGEWRADVRSAQVCSTVANVMRQKGSAYKLDDFMIEFGPPDREPMSPREIARHMRNITAAMGGRVESSRK